MSSIALVLATTTASPAKIVFALLVAAGVLGLGLAVVLMSGDNRGKIERRLGDLMQEQTDATADEDEAFVPKGDQALAETALMQRMVGLTGRLADRAGLLSRTEDALEQADLPLRPPEALFFYFAGLLVVGMLGLLVLPIPMALVLALLAGVVPVIMLHRRRRGRLREFQMQLPGTLNLLSGSMRAGFSFAQGLESVANEATQPTRRELQRVFTESRLGRPIEDALEDSAQRMTSIDLMWAVMAIRIQREVGGNLAELLDTVARDDDPTGAVAPRDQGAHGRRTLLGLDPRPLPHRFRWDPLPHPAGLHERAVLRDVRHLRRHRLRDHDLHRLHLAPQDPPDRGVT